MNWKIEFMKCVPQIGSIKDYVVECGWRCIATQDNHSADAYGTCSFAAPDNPDGTFTPYDKLTEDMVLGWVWSSGVDKDQIEASLAKQLDSLINPPAVVQPLPWAA